MNLFFSLIDTENPKREREKLSSPILSNEIVLSMVFLEHKFSILRKLKDAVKFLTFVSQALKETSNDKLKRFVPSVD